MRFCQAILLVRASTAVSVPPYFAPKAGGATRPLPGAIRAAWPIRSGHIEVVRTWTIGHRRPVCAAVAAGGHQGRGVPRRAEDAFDHPAFKRLRTLWDNR